MRTRHFKMMLTETEHQQLKDLAGDQRVSAADLVRFLVFGSGAVGRLPSAASLREIAYILSSISSNINRCMKEIHSSKLNGTITDKQFAAMYRALEAGHIAWRVPRDDLRTEIKRIKNNGVQTAK